MAREKIIVASSVDRKELLGRGLFSMDSGTYMGKVISLRGDRVELDTNGFVTDSALCLYEVAEPQARR